MSTGIVYHLYVKSKSGEWVHVGPDYSLGFPFLYSSSVNHAKEHYEKLGLETKIEDGSMEFDDR